MEGTQKILTLLFEEFVETWKNQKCFESERVRSRAGNTPLPSYFGLVFAESTF